MTYRAFVADNLRFLALGFVLCFFSSFGQTFFIGVFGGALRADFGLSDGAFGTLYSLATLSSGLLLLVLGRGVDRHGLRGYATIVCLALAAACLLMANARITALLFVALFALRLSGQGLMGHIAMTSMARYFAAHRAKAISLAAVGFATGEAIWPRAAIAALDRFSWRGIWLLIAGLCAVVLVPLVAWLLRGHHERHRTHLHELASVPSSSAATPRARQWTRAEVVRDPRFYLFCPAVLAPPMIVTGMFFHQVRIAELRGWSMSFYGNCFVAFAIVQFVTGLGLGPLIDRVGARRALPFAVLPIGVGLGLLACCSGAWVCPAYLIATGVTAGMASTVTGALWAEVYGVVHLGAIRAMASALMVLSTAVSPAATGLALDAGANVETIAAAWTAYVVVGSVLAWVGGRRSAGVAHDLHASLVRVNAFRHAGRPNPEWSALETTLEASFGCRHRLAVYGTLRPGAPNHHVVAGLGGRWQHGIVHGTLHPTGWGAAVGYPALRWDPGGAAVDVALLTSRRLADDWARLDAFEGEGYRRILVPVQRDGALLGVANLYEARKPPS